jgi:outer membrane receptor protein involved in Fe transport
MHESDRSFRGTSSRALALAIAAILASGAARAEAPATAAGDLRQLEEIVVTASKRSESLQSLPMAVTAITSDVLLRANVTDISRLDALVPGMQFGASGNEVRLALRGTRQNNVGTEAEQSVGIFQDGVYVPTTTQAFGAYIDVNRIEVLRGPQGTLYGRNTFGGTVNIITNDATFDGVNGFVGGLYGDYNRYRVDGVVNVPLADNFAVRLAGVWDQRQGYVENTYKSGSSDDLVDADQSGFRLSAKWQATENLSAMLKVQYNDSSSNGSAIWGYQQIGAYIDGEYVKGHQFAPPDASCCFDQGPWKVARNQKSNADTQDTSYTLQMDWQFPGFATLRFIGNYTAFDGSQNFDSDYSDGGDPLNNGFTGWDSSQDTWSTELQLISDQEGRLDWLLGFYYYDQTSNWNWVDLENGKFTTPYWDNQGDYTSDSLGIYGNATYEITDDFRLTGGLRYADDSKQQRDQLDWSVFPPVSIPNSGSDGSWNKVLWRAGLEYDISDDVMTYFTASTGYRAGGINFIQEGVPLTYDPETVTAYELGLKSTLFERSMILNVSAYYNDYQNLQAQSFVIIGETVTEFTENGGQETAKGIEVELTWVPGGDSNWNITAQMAYSKAEFGKYEVSKVQGLGDLGGRQDLNDPTSLLSLKGWSPALSPEWTLGAQVLYDFKLPNGSVLTPYAQTYYSDSYYSFDINVPGVQQDSYTRTDLRLMWTSPNSAWEAEAFVQNLEDEAVLLRTVVFNPSERPEIASLQSNWSNPRTWGMGLRYRF